MSDFSVIHDMSLTLRTLLQQGLAASGTQVEVTIDSPHKENLPEPRVNLFLYLLRQDEHRRSPLPVVIQHDQGQPWTVVREPLALNLYYLLTAFAQDGLSEHRLLGEAMQILRTHQELTREMLSGSMAATGTAVPESLQIVLLNLDLETINNIWGNNVALLRASVAYEVSAVFLDQPTLTDPEDPSRNNPRQVPEVSSTFQEMVPVPYLLHLEPDLASPGQTLRLYGSNLHQAGVRVLFEDGTTTWRAAPSRQRPGSLSVVIPPDVRPGQVRVRVAWDTFHSRELPLKLG